REHHARLAGAVGAEQRGDLARRDLERDPAHDVAPAARDHKVFDAQEVARGGHATSSVPRYARITRSSRSTSAVGPDAIILPKSSTAVISQHDDTRLMSWSTRIVSAPECSGI